MWDVRSVLSDGIGLFSPAVVSDCQDELAAAAPCGVLDVVFSVSGVA